MRSCISSLTFKTLQKPFYILCYIHTLQSTDIDFIYVSASVIVHSLYFYRPIVFLFAHSILRV